MKAAAMKSPPMQSAPMQSRPNAGDPLHGITPSSSTPDGLPAFTPNEIKQIVSNHEARVGGAPNAVSVLARNIPPPPQQVDGPALSALAPGQGGSLADMMGGSGIPEQSRAPVTLRSLGMTVPTMGGMAHQQPGFVAPKHAWKKKEPTTNALAEVLKKPRFATARNDEWDGTNDSGGW